MTTTAIALLFWTVVLIAGARALYVGLTTPLPAERDLVGDDAYDSGYAHH